MDSSKGVKLFVGALPLQANDEDLRAAFLKFTPVVHAKVEVGRQLRISRGFGYVVIADPDAIPLILTSTVEVLGVKVDVQLALQKKSKNHQAQSPVSHFTGSLRSHPTTCENTPAQANFPSVMPGKSSQDGRHITSMSRYGNSKFAEYLIPGIDTHLYAKAWEIQSSLEPPKLAETIPKPVRTNRWSEKILNQRESNYRFNQQHLSAAQALQGNRTQRPLYQLF